MSTQTATTTASKLQFFCHYYTIFFHFNPAGFIFLHFVILGTITAFIFDRLLVTGRIKL